MDLFNVAIQIKPRVHPKRVSHLRPRPNRRRSIHDPRKPARSVQSTAISLPLTCKNIPEQIADNCGPLAQNHFMVLFLAAAPRRVPDVNAHNSFAINNLRVTKAESLIYRAVPTASN